MAKFIILLCVLVALSFVVATDENGAKGGKIEKRHINVRLGKRSVNGNDNGEWMTDDAGLGGDGGNVHKRSIYRTRFGIHGGNGGGSQGRDGTAGAGGLATNTSL